MTKISGLIFDGESTSSPQHAVSRFRSREVHVLCADDSIISNFYLKFFLTDTLLFSSSMKACDSKNVNRLKNIIPTPDFLFIYRTIL